MNAARALLSVLFLHGTIAGVVRKPPAFSTPAYSDSYLPAAMQVIFHAVEQLKVLQAEEAAQQTISAQRTNTSVSASTIKTTAEQTSQTTTSKPTSTLATAVTSTDTNQAVSLNKETNIIVQAASQALEIAENLATTGRSAESSTIMNAGSQQVGHQEAAEESEETPEANYATSEANYETPESVHGTQETNYELSEENQEFEPGTLSTVNVPKVNRVIVDDPADATCSTLTVLEPEVGDAEVTDPGQKKKEPTIDSVVEEIYEIVKPTPSLILEDVGDNGESKSSSGVSVEKMEILEDEEDETRFTLLGEKVAQVPRPSLTNYLKRAKVPLSASLEQLATLYDSLSKDARKQGFGKYAGYSDEVLKTLESSAEGGVGPQLRILLTRILERGELTRDDAKVNTTAAIRDLNDTSTSLSKDCKRLLPLRYVS